MWSRKDDEGRKHSQLGHETHTHTHTHTEHQIEVKDIKFIKLRTIHYKHRFHTGQHGPSKISFQRCNLRNNPGSKK
jgi:hypothetical protein